jgi:hypothetical protein
MPAKKINTPAAAPAPTPTPTPTPTQVGGADAPLSDRILASIHDINMNPYLLGLAYILLNLGGRFMVMSVTPAQEAFLQNIVFRPLLLFAIMFIGTRNLIVAFWLTLVILLLLHYLLNENSDWYLLRPWSSEKHEYGSYQN